MNATPSRRWFRFSLRSMFALITLACVAAGWATYQLNWIKQRREARLELNGEGIGAIYKSAAAYSHDVRAPGLLWLFGEQGEREIVLFTNVITDEETVRFKLLFPETSFTTMPLTTW